MRKKVSIIFLLTSGLALMFLFLFLMYTNLMYPVLYKAEIVKVSLESLLPPSVVASLINVESSYRKDVVSNKGAIGLMQVMPSTGQWVANKMKIDNYSEEKLFDAEINIAIGTYYLKYLIGKFENIDLAICAYNAGEGTVQNWLKISTISSNGKTLDNIPFEETQNHLQKFHNNLKHYQNKYKSIEKLMK